MELARSFRPPRYATVKELEDVVYRMQDEQESKIREVK
jgi:hypothetical protein